ncbi:MAG: CDP-alcohol phosphatidyltransferase, partial [Bacteroidota bacterium]
FTGTNTWLALLGFICMQTQGTVYNYYHVIFRHHTAGEITSQIFEDEVPTAYPGERQVYVNVLYRLFRVLYKVFDKFVYAIDPRASIQAECPKWFMFLVSFYGLGFQLLIIAVFLVLGMMHLIIPFFIGYSVLIPVFVGIRRVYLR